MKQITPSDIRRAFEERERRIAANASHDAVCSPTNVVERVNARQRRRRALRKWCVALAAAAAVVTGVLVIRPIGNPGKSGPVDKIVADLARAGIKGECSVSQTEVVLPNGAKVITCRVVVDVTDSEKRDDIMCAHGGLASVIATYDSVVRDGIFVTSLTTEMNYADGVSIVRAHN